MVGTHVLEFQDFRMYRLIEPKPFSETNQRGKATIYSRTIDGSKGLKELIPHVMDFTEQVSTRNWREDTKKILFGTTLQGIARVYWNECVQGLNEEGHIRNLDQAIRALVAKYTPTNLDVRYEIIEYLREYTKPHDMQVGEFLSDMRLLNKSASWFPGQANLFNENEFTYAFYKAMPPNWINKFIGASLHYYNMTADEIAVYFSGLQETKTPQVHPLQV